MWSHQRNGVIACLGWAAHLTAWGARGCCFPSRLWKLATLIIQEMNLWRRQPPPGVPGPLSHALDLDSLLPLGLILGVTQQRCNSAPPSERVRLSSGRTFLNVPANQMYEVTPFTRFRPSLNFALTFETGQHLTEFVSLRYLGWEFVMFASVDLLFPSRFHYENVQTYRKAESTNKLITKILLYSSNCNLPALSHICSLIYPPIDLI